MGETRIYCPVCKSTVGLRQYWGRHKKSQEHQDNLKTNDIPIKEVWTCPTHGWTMHYNTVASHMHKYHTGVVNLEKRIHEDDI